jgi:putative ABC transport system permease protein
MLDLDSWREIWAVLRSNRLRTFLTAFGVFWGILMLMLMLGFGSAMQAGIKRQARGMATNLLFVWGQSTTKAYDGLQPNRWIKFKHEDIELLKTLPGIEWLAPRLQLGGWMSNFNVSYEGKTGAFNVFADYPEFKHIVAFEYEAGRFINDRDIAEQRKIVVIGKAVVDELYPPGTNPIGTYIKISGVYFQVVGVTRTLRSGQQGDRDAHTLFVPFTTLKTAFHIPDRVDFFALTAKPGTDGPELERQVREALSKQHHIAPDDKVAIGSFNAFVIFNKFETVFVVLWMMSWIVGGATLLAGVVGVSNIMLITVKERTKEFGVRKALGATPREVVFMVLKESIVLTAIAGLVGIAAGTGILAGCGALFEKIPDFPLSDPTVSLGNAMVAVVVLIVCGALAGIMPAAHAASIKPVEALRAE